MSVNVIFSPLWNDVCERHYVVLFQKGGPREDAGGMEKSNVKAKIKDQHLRLGLHKILLYHSPMLTIPSCVVVLNYT